MDEIRRSLNVCAGLDDNLIEPDPAGSSTQPSFVSLPFTLTRPHLIHFPNFINLKLPVSFSFTHLYNFFCPRRVRVSYYSPTSHSLIPCVSSRRFFFSFFPRRLYLHLLSRFSHWTISERSTHGANHCLLPLHQLFLLVLGLNLVATGCRTRMRTLLGIQQA